MTVSKAAFNVIAKQGWKHAGKKLAKSFVFKDFKQAIKFMNSVVPHINKLDHHPEWRNVYNKLTVRLTTHDAGGVTMKDIQLAKIMDKMAAPFQAKE